MARIKRVVIPNIPHHITQRGVRSMTIFNNDYEREKYLGFIKIMALRYGIEYLGYCLMDNHVHFIGIPKEEDSLALGIGEAHRQYTLMKNAEDKVKGHLFQERFFSCPTDEKHTISTLRYIERNPIRAGIIKNAWDYKWSSAKIHVGLKSKDNFIDYNFLNYSKDEWKNMLEIEPDEIGYIRKCYKTGRPCGEMRFFVKCKKITGIDFTPKKRGPKAKYFNK